MITRNCEGYLEKLKLGGRSEDQSLENQKSVFGHRDKGQEKRVRVKSARRVVCVSEADAWMFESWRCAVDEWEKKKVERRIGERKMTRESR